MAVFPGSPGVSDNFRVCTVFAGARQVCAAQLRELMRQDMGRMAAVLTPLLLVEVLSHCCISNGFET